MKLQSPRLEIPAVVKKWVVFVVPAIAVCELLLHLHQVSSVVPDADWDRAKAEVQKQVKPDDLVAFAPRWVDPIGREHFGDGIATLEREAYPDVTRFPRAIEVGIRGEHLADLAGWRQVGREKVGAITITTFANPSPVTLRDDLLRHVGKPEMHVELDGPGGDHECRFGRFGVQTGGLGFGPAVPALRYQCGGNAFAGISILPDLDYRPRRCIYAPAQGANNVVRIRVDDFAFGRVLHGHHGLYVEAERDKKGAPVEIAFRSGDKSIGRLVHRDGEGWKGFELDTSDLAGKSAELDAEITSVSRDRRMYCFEVDAR
jgi:hypothetical protein